MHSIHLCVKTIYLTWALVWEVGTYSNFLARRHEPHLSLSFPVSYPFCPHFLVSGLVLLLLLVLVMLCYSFSFLRPFLFVVRLSFPLGPPRNSTAPFLNLLVLFEVAVETFPPPPPPPPPPPAAACIVLLLLLLRNFCQSLSLFLFSLFFQYRLLWWRFFTQNQPTRVFSRCLFQLRLEVAPDRFSATNGPRRVCLHSRRTSS